MTADESQYENDKPLVAVTAGEPAGIGPDLCVMLAAQPLPARIVVVADRDLLAQRARLLGRDVKLVDFNPNSDVAPGTLAVKHVPLETRVDPGRLD